MSKIIYCLIVVLLPALSHAKITEGVLEIQPGEKVYYFSSIVHPKKLTLILLPGVFRGLQKEDSIIKLLEDKKINFVAIHFSGHPKSIIQYKPIEKTIFAGGKGLTSEMLAHEVDAVVDQLKIEKPIPVSLSYSSTVVPFLSSKKYSLVIETSPLGMFGEEDPESLQLQKTWAQWLQMWPYWGPIWVESAKNTAYRNHWAPIATQRIAADSEMNAADHTNNLTDGYMALARATEDFDLRKENFKTTAPRIWVLAANENSNRFQIQQEAITLSNKTKKQNVVPIIVPDAGHTIPIDQPDAYAQVLETILQQIENKN